MKRFSFPLEAVRRWRHDQSDIEELKMRRLHLELDGINQQRAGLEAESIEADRQTRTGGSPSAEELAQLDQFRRYVLARSRQIDAQRTECERRVSEQRTCLIEARRRSELLDQLKDKARMEWEAQAAKEEETLASEAFLAKRHKRTIA